MVNSFYKNKKILLTGDTGFKGSWLAIWLLEMGANVVGYSLKPKTEKDNYVICNLKNKYNTNIDDIRNYENLYNVINKEQPDIIFHLAAQPLVLESYDDPVETFTTNIIGTLNILEALRKTQKTKLLINITTDKCYENKEWIYPYREIDPLGGKDPYSASKACSEILTHSYNNSFFSKSSDILIATARAGNVIGGGDWSSNRLIPDCVRSLSKNEEIILRNPNSIRPWQHVLDALYGYLILAEKIYNEGKEFSGSWNFGPYSTNQMPVLNIVEKFINYWGTGSYKIENNETHKKEASLLALDINKAIKNLDWFPVLDINKTLDFTSQEYKIDNLNSNEIYDQRVTHINKYLEVRKEILLNA